MIEKNILRFLQFRETVFDTRPLEEKYKIELPPIYKSFISVFQPYFAHHKVKKEGEDDYQSFIIPCYSSVKKEEYSSDDDELSFDYFKELEEVLSDERSNEGHLKDLLFIANHGYSGGLLIGIAEHNMDKVYHNSDSIVVTFVANNIYELLLKFQLVQYDFELPEINTNELYKNWGEGFWRVKDNFNSDII